MSTVVLSYNNAPFLLGDGLIQFSSDPIRVALLEGTYTPDVVAHTVFADVSAFELNPATFTNYVAGGELLVNSTFAQAGGTATFDADDITWTGASITARFGVVYIDATAGAYAKPLLFYILFDDLPQDVSREDFTIKWAPSGVVTIPKSS